MAAYGVSVEKTLTFRGAVELTSSVYHYRIDAAIESDFNNLADLVVARDKLVHTNDFTYKTVRVFGPTEGSQSANLMRLVKDVSGNGTRTFVAGTPWYPELCYVVTKYVGRSPVHNRKVFVKKFIHIIRQRSAGSNSSSGQLDQAERDFVAQWMDGNQQIGSVGGQFTMVTPKNVIVPADNPAQCLGYARIRQLHQ